MRVSDAAGPAKQILLIEDNPADVELVREALLEHSVQCDLALVTNGETALAFIDAIELGEVRCPDLIIIDLRLPIIPGREVLRYLQATARCKHLPVLVLSSSDSAKDRAETAALGATRYVQKPFRLVEYLQLGIVFKQMLGFPK
jgi:two-component system, chemotaxis family, response regulator Rcp1